MPTDPLETTPSLEEIPLDLGDGRPPLSKLAILAGIIGLVCLIPWAPAIAFMSQGSGAIKLGMLVGIVGASIAIILGVLSILKTRHYARRGRWIGITGGIFGLLGIATNLLVGFGLFLTKASFGCAQDAVLVLKASSTDRAPESEKWIEEFASKRLTVSIKPNEFEDWLEQVSKKHGQLQQSELSKTQPISSANGVIVVNMKGHFVNGMSAIEVHIGIDGDQAKVDDFKVGGSSPLD
ncbi:MAG: hypothetical protein DHS20C16_29120 [Phycisphaerae bacterium]|nr:MAG: hypothetical protein DHS20C16_29120 [Phycisphaerae bacterium]